MVRQKRAAKRLKISTGDSDAAKKSYVRKLAKQQSHLAKAPKSNEEKQLEAQLFGNVVQDDDDAAGAYDGNDAYNGPTSWLDSLRKGKVAAGAGNYGENSAFDDDEDAARLAALANDDLFMMDDTTGFKGDVEIPQTYEDDKDGSQEDDEEEDESRIASTSTNFLGQRALKSKASLWHDPADAHISVSLQDTSRLRKLRDNASEDVVSGPEYEERLRRHYKKLHPEPSWASKARKQKKRGRAGSEDSNDVEVDLDSDEEGAERLRKILQNTSAGIHNRKQKSRGPLPATELQIHRLRDANQVAKSTSPITALQFHPTIRSNQVLFTTSEDRRLKLYQIDGTHNPMIQTVHFPELPISNAAFHPSGNSVFLTGNRPFYYAYDLQAGQIIRSPKGLLAGGVSGTDLKGDKQGGGMELFKFSPDGTMVAIAGRRGYVHLLDWGSNQNGVGNGGQILGSVKMNSGIAGLSWRNNGLELVTVGLDASVYVWDVGTRRCLQRWNDDGGFGPTAVSTDSAEKYFAIGSKSGIVNVYDSSQSFSDSEEASTSTSKPLKSIMNLTTSISSMSFNGPSEILALASKTKKDALRLIHLPSLTVFSNWPTSGTPLGHISAMGFSRGSEYLALGNHRGKVLLYTLDHYANR